MSRFNHRDSLMDRMRERRRRRRRARLHDGGLSHGLPDDDHHHHHRTSGPPSVIGCIMVAIIGFIALMVIGKVLSHMSATSFPF